MNDLMKSDLKMSSLNIRTTYRIQDFKIGGALKKIIFLTKYPKMFAPPSTRPNFFKVPPPNLKSWNPPLKIDIAN
jgi:hypothetical protein